MKNKDTWIIFGCSPYINTISDKIPYLCQNYTTIGLNMFPVRFPQIDYWMFSDKGIFTGIYNEQRIKPHHKLIVGERVKPELYQRFHWFRPHKQCILIDNPEMLHPVHYIFGYVIDFPVIKECGKLLLMKSIVTSALNYTLLQGAKKVILAGIDLNKEWNHFYDLRPTYKNKSIKRCLSDIETIKQKIDLFKPYFEIYKVNKDANIDVEYIDINDL